MGLESQLAFFIGFFTLLSVILYFWRARKIDSPKKEESIGSKEFWMFIGSLVLLFSAIMITASSSLPIFNKVIALFNPEFIGYVIDDPVEHYNKYQLWIGVLVGILSGVSIFFRYNEKNNKRFWGKPKNHLLIVTAATIFLHLLINLWLQLQGFQFHLLLFAGLFTIVASLEHIFFYTMAKKGSQAPKKSNYLASVLAHSGFGLMLVGVIASGLNKSYISENQFVMDGIMDEDAARKNITLLKNRPMFMNGYWVTYSKDTVIGQNKYFDLDFRQVDETGKITLDEFQLTPNVLYSNDLTKIAARNPDTRHFFLKDIFVSVESLPLAQQDIEFAKEMEDTLNYELVTFAYDEKAKVDNYTIELKDISFNATHPDYKPEQGDVPIQMSLELKDTLGNQTITKPATVLRNSIVYKFHSHEDNFHSRFRINEKSFEEIVKPDIALEYSSFKMKQGETTNLDGYKVSLEKFNKVDSLTAFVETGDIAVEGEVLIENASGDKKVLYPKFIIRDNQLIPLRDLWWQESLYVRLSNIDPSNGAATIELAKDNIDKPNIALEVATNVPRQDILAIQAIEFPGINFVWLGCIMMMVGLGLGMILRFNKA
jgi:cytochrome c-type biogenesis protein CcmF